MFCVQGVKAVDDGGIYVWRVMVGESTKSSPGLCKEANTGLIVVATSESW